MAGVAMSLQPSICPISRGTLADRRSSNPKISRRTEARLSGNPGRAFEPENAVEPVIFRIP
jgi:hypothetical protein